MEEHDPLSAPICERIKGLKVIINMIANVEIDLTRLDIAELQVQQVGHAVMVDLHLSHLPKTEDGTVDYTRLTENPGNDLVSPLTSFQRLINTRVRLDQIREELTRRGVPPAGSGGETA